MTLIAALAACGSTPELSALIAHKIDAAGGTISAPGFEMTIPSGALSEAVEITISTAMAPPGFVGFGESAEVVGPILSFGPDGLHFKVPIEVSFELPAGVGEDVAIMWSEGDTFLPLSSVRAGSRLVGHVNHFSKAYVARFKGDDLPLCLASASAFWLPERKEVIAFYTYRALTFSGDPLVAADMWQDVKVTAPGLTLADVMSQPPPRTILRRWRDPTTGLEQRAILACCVGPKADTVLRLDAETATWVENGHLSKGYYDPVLAIMRGGPMDGALIVVGADRAGLESTYDSSLHPVYNRFKIRGEFFAPEAPERSGKKLPGPGAFRRPPFLLPAGDGHIVMMSVQATNIVDYDSSQEDRTDYYESSTANFTRLGRGGPCVGAEPGPLEGFSPSLTEAMGNNTQYVFPRLSGALVLADMPNPKILAYAGKDYIVYDAFTGCWTAGVFDQNRSRAVSLRTADTTAFLIGGHAATAATAEKYDPATNTWSTVPFGKNSTPLANPAMAVVGTSAVLVGGTTTPRSFETVALTGCGHIRAHGESQSRAESPHLDAYGLAHASDPRDEELTVEAWVKLESAPSGDYGVVLSHYDVAAHDGYMLAIAKDLTPAFLMAAGDETGQARSESPITLGRWTHLAGVLKNHDLEVFVGGDATGTDRAPESLPSATASLLIGNDGTGNAPVDGAIDEVRVSTIARYASLGSDSPAAPRRLAKDASTVALFHFDETSGAVAAQDSSTNAAKATLESGAAIEIDCEP